MDITTFINTINNLYNENNSIDSFKLYVTYNQKKKHLIITSFNKNYKKQTIFLKNITTTKDIINELDKEISKMRYKI